MRWDFAGQALAEFALMIPILILLLFGMTFAAFYAFRSAAVDWGVFVTGVATGSYNTPATAQARESVLWPDLAERIGASQSGPRQVRSIISVEDSRDWVFGIRLVGAPPAPPRPFACGGSTPARHHREASNEDRFI